MIPWFQITVHRFAGYSLHRFFIVDKPVHGLVFLEAVAVELDFVQFRRECFVLADGDVVGWGGDEWVVFFPCVVTGIVFEVK